MEQAFSRTELLLGSSALERLGASRVAVFGIGGVGGYVCEALARTGVGHLDLIDSDTIAVSNINRQIIATTKTVGQYKTDAMEARILDINPAAKITKHNCFFLPETAADFPFNQYDYVVDAVDTMSAKLALGAAQLVFQRQQVHLLFALLGQVSCCLYGRVRQRGGRALKFIERGHFQHLSYFTCFT